MILLLLSNVLWARKRFLRKHGFREIVGSVQAFSAAQGGFAGIDHRDDTEVRRISPSSFQPESGEKRDGRNGRDREETGTKPRDSLALLSQQKAARRRIHFDRVEANTNCFIISLEKPGLWLNGSFSGGSLAALSTGRRVRT